MFRLRWSFLLVTCVALCFTSADMALCEPFQLTVGNTAYTFADPSAGLGLSEIRLRREDIRCFVHEEDPPPIWTLVLINREGEELTIDSTADCETTVTPTGPAGLQAGWRSVSLMNEKNALTVVLRLNGIAGQDAVQARLEAKNNSAAWSIREVFFPCFSLRATTAAPEEIMLVFPRDVGRSWRDPFNGPRGFLVGTHVGIQYPGAGQFGMMVDDHGHGLYWATHDPAAMYKRFQYHPNPDADTLLARVIHYADDNNKPGNDFCPPYPVVLQPFQGDWWDGAQIYRRWAMKQAWMSKGPLRQRRDIPEWLKKCNVWIRGDSRRAIGHHGECILNYGRLFGTPMGVQWYNWHRDETWMNPEASPAEGIPDQITAFRKAGIYPLPYVNSLLWNQELPSFDSEVRAATIKEPDGKPLAYYSSKGTQYGYEMCAHTPLWRRTLVDQCKHLVGDFHCGGIYLDQSGRQANEICYDASHGHVIGPAAGTKAVRGMFARIRSAVRSADEDAILAGEAYADCFIDLLDARLNHYNIWPGYVPLWPAVYSDYSVSFGRSILWRSKWGEGANFYARAGTAFVSGIQLGRVWVSAPELQLDAPDYREQLSFFERIVAYRKIANRFLELGHMQRPITITPSPPKLMVTDAKDRQMEIEALLASAWCDDQGNLGLFFVNIDATPFTFTFHFDIDRSEARRLERYDIIVREIDASSVAGVLTGTKLSHTLTLDRHDVVFIEVSPSHVEE